MHSEPIAKEYCQIALEAIRQLFEGVGHFDMTGDAGNLGEFNVCVSIRHMGVVRGCWSATATTIKSAIRIATVRAVKDQKKGSQLLRRELDSADIEVWIMEERREIDYPVPDQLFAGEGIQVLTETSGGAFFLPSVAVESGLTTSNQLLDRLLSKAKLRPKMRGNARLFRTRWKHFVYSSSLNRAYELIRLRDAELPLPCTRDALLQSAEDAARNLSGNQIADGSYIYECNRGAVTYRRAGNYSQVRLLGCTLALARYLKFVRAQGAMQYCPIEQAVCLGIEFVCRRIRSLRESVAFQTDEGEAFLGDNAFSLLCLLEAGSSDSLIRGLGQSILLSQAPAGWFPQNLSKQKECGPQDFAPAQAIIALVLARQRGALDIDDQLEAAFAHYSSVDISVASPFFLAWQAKAWLTASSHQGTPMYADFAFRLLDRLGQLQIDMDEQQPADFAGGYRARFDQDGFCAPPSFLVGLYTEATIAGWRAACGLGRDEAASRYRKRVISGLRFLQVLQIRKEQSLFFARPEVYVGGFRKDVASFSLRCDYTMHALTCMVAALDAGLYEDELDSASCIH